jgi:hypothetical protein
VPQTVSLPKNGACATSPNAMWCPFCCLTPAGAIPILRPLPALWHCHVGPEVSIWAHQNVLEDHEWTLHAISLQFLYIGFGSAILVLSISVKGLAKIKEQCHSAVSLILPLLPVHRLLCWNQSVMHKFLKTNETSASSTKAEWRPQACQRAVRGVCIGKARTLWGSYRKYLLPGCPPFKLSR